MEDGFIKGFLLFPVTLAHIDKVAPEFAFLDELLKLLHVEGVVQETVKLAPLVDLPVSSSPSPDGKGGGEEIVGWHIFGDFFGVEAGNHADAGVVFVFIQHLLAELEKGNGGTSSSSNTMHLSTLEKAHFCEMYSEGSQPKFFS